MFEKPVKKIMYCYSHWNTTLSSIQEEDNVEFYEGIPTEEKVVAFCNSKEEEKLIVFDDLACSIGNSRSIVHKVFLIIARHTNTSAIYTCQDLTESYNNALISNSQIIVCLKNHRNIRQVNLLDRRLCMQNQVKNAFKHVMQSQKVFDYLLIDLDQTSCPEYTLRSSIFPPEETIVYR